MIRNKYKWTADDEYMSREIDRYQLQRDLHIRKREISRSRKFKTMLYIVIAILFLKSCELAFYEPEEHALQSAHHANSR